MSSQYFWSRMMKDSLKERRCLAQTSEVGTSSSILSYTVPVSIPVTKLGLRGRRKGAPCDGEMGDEGRRGGGAGGASEKAKGGKEDRETEGCRTVSAYARERFLK